MHSSTEIDSDGIETTTFALIGLTGQSSGTVTNSGALADGASAVAAASLNSTFDIVIRYSGDPTYQAAFTQAAARWSQIIVADITDASVSAQFHSQYNLPGTIDD